VNEKAEAKWNKDTANNERERERKQKRKKEKEIVKTRSA